MDMFIFWEFISKAVKVLVEDIKTCIYNAGFSSGFFYPTCGIRQGCCCSPTLFILAVKLLSVLACHSPNIEGIQVCNQKISITQYADDTIFLIKNATPMDVLIQLVEVFTDFSGLKINRQQSYILLLGNYLHSPLQYKDC